MADTRFLIMENKLFLTIVNTGQYLLADNAPGKTFFVSLTGEIKMKKLIGLGVLAVVALGSTASITALAEEGQFMVRVRAINLDQC